MFVGGQVGSLAPLRILGPLKFVCLDHVMTRLEAKAVVLQLVNDAIKQACLHLEYATAISYQNETVKNVLSCSLLPRVCRSWLRAVTKTSISS